MAIPEVKDLIARFEALVAHLHAHGMPPIGQPPVEPDVVNEVPDPVVDPQAGG